MKKNYNLQVKSDKRLLFTTICSTLHYVRLLVRLFVPLCTYNSDRNNCNRNIMLRDIPACTLSLTLVVYAFYETLPTPPFLS